VSPFGPSHDGPPDTRPPVSVEPEPPEPEWMVGPAYRGPGKPGWAGEAPTAAGMAGSAGSLSDVREEVVERRDAGGDGDAVASGIGIDVGVRVVPQ
jgi:hypothetical protein